MEQERPTTTENTETTTTQGSPIPTPEPSAKQSGQAPFAPSSAKPPATHYPPVRKVKLLAIVMLFILSISSGIFGSWLFTRNDTTDTQKQQVVLKSQGQLISNIAKNVGESVVSVDVTSTSNYNRGFLGMGQFAETEQQSAGTGIILDKDGLIITNRHVVPQGTQRVNVVLSDGTTYEDVEVIGRTNSQDSLDIAFLKIKDTNGKELVPAEIGDSSKVSIGDSVVAIGNALGQFQNTVTSGIISGHGRSVEASSGDTSSSETESLEDLFQTDAAINEGNSGGPLVNLEGQVIGINTAVAAGDAQNIGFAIPINDVSGLIKSVKETGKLQRPYLGLVYVSLTDDIAKQYNLKATRGAYVPAANVLGQDTVIDGAPADKAGIKEGDIIIKVNDQAIDDKTSITSALGRYSVGDEVKLTILRGDKQLTLEARLANAPSEQ